MKMTVEFSSIADLANFSKFIDQRLEEEAKTRELNNLRGQLDLAKNQLERAYARLRFKDDKPDMAKIYATPLDQVPLRVRTFNCLVAEGCETVGHVMQLFDKNQLRGIPNFGNGSFSNLKRVFAEEFKIELNRSNK
jgi:DNA-directed RNA polymerase alpha subunit